MSFSCTGWHQHIWEQSNFISDHFVCTFWHNAPSYEIAQISDFNLPCFSRPVCLCTSVRNVRHPAWFYMFHVTLFHITAKLSLILSRVGSALTVFVDVIRPTLLPGQGSIELYYETTAHASRKIKSTLSQSVPSSTALHCQHNESATIANIYHPYAQPIRIIFHGCLASDLIALSSSSTPCCHMLS